MANKLKCSMGGQGVRVLVRVNRIKVCISPLSPLFPLSLPLLPCLLAYSPCFLLVAHGVGRDMVESSLVNDGLQGSMAFLLFSAIRASLSEGSKLQEGTMGAFFTSLQS